MVGANQNIDFSLTDEAISILHVDDDPDFVDVAADLLEREDDRFEVSTVKSPIEALDRIAEGDFDCLVSDYEMPEMNGIELLKSIREDYPDLPVILFTGKGSEEVASEAIVAGVTDYLQKETGTEQYSLLANRIKNAVESYRGLQHATNLERIRTIVRDVNQTLVRSSSRGEIESRVCNIVSAADPYQLAVIGEFDPETNRFTPRAAAGKGDESIDEIAVDREPSPQRPIEVAIHDRSLAFSQNIQETTGFHWNEIASEYDFQSVAAVPLDYEGDRYGAFIVCADRTYAFDDREQELLVELAGDIAHAFAAIETRRELVDERDRRAALFENTPDPIMEVGFEGEIPIIEDINTGFEETFGFDAEDVIGSSVADIVVPETEREGHEKLRRHVFQGGSVEREVRRKTASGTREFLLRIIPFDVSDVSSGAYAWYTDITERKDRERALERAKQHFQQIFEQSNDAIMIIDPHEGVIRDANSRACEMLGYDRDELLSLSPSDIHPDEIERFQEFVDTVYDEGAGWTSDLTCLTKESQRLPAQISASVIEIDDRRHMLAIIRDVTERKKRERELRETKERFQKIFEHSNDAIMLVDLEEESFIEVNPAACDMLGYYRAELLDLHPEDIHPADIDRVRDEFISQVVEEGAGWTDQLRCLTKDGEIVPTEISGAVLNSTTESEKPTRMVAILRDISEREAYKRDLEQQIEQLDEFARTVSHDLRNPLNVANGRLELAREESDSEHLDDIESALDRMSEIIERTLTLAQSGQVVGETELVELEQLVDGCWESVESESADVKIEDAPTVSADPDRLRHVIENLFRNAITYGGDDVTIRIGRLEDGFYFEDDGPGIPDEKKEDVFDAGYSSSSDGTGFGLAIVQQIVKAHGWQIELTEGDMGGARFEITDVEITK